GSWRSGPPAVSAFCSAGSTSAATCFSFGSGGRQRPRPGSAHGGGEAGERRGSERHPVIAAILRDRRRPSRGRNDGLLDCPDVGGGFRFHQERREARNVRCCLRRSV